MITHVWGMTFNDHATAQRREEFLQAMAELPALTGETASFKAGADIGLNPGNSDVTIVAEFTDAQAWRNYIDAPAHQEFIEKHVNPLCASWNAIQFNS
ncbi:Dabb family protein [Glutamicibacter sp. NPDC127525]|uniref:Dabb family protein n=1 Tax=unclassified Glutamicibacter TaxID=2627139 RepID=UPI0036378B05